MNDPVIVTVLEGWKVTSSSDAASTTSSSTSKWKMILQQMNDVMISGKQNKDTAAATRKILSDSTKTLKKTLKTCESTVSTTANSNAKVNIDELAIQCKSTIKSYQEEIDNLTKRCKLYEQSYQTIINDMPPDPTIVLQTLVVTNGQNQNTIQQLNNQLQQLEQDNKKLTTELQNTTKKLNNTKSSTTTSTITKEEYDELYKLRKEVIEYDNEIKNLKNQDVTVRKLEAKIEELQTSGAIAIDNAIQTVKTELQENEGKKLVLAYEQQEQLSQTISSLQIQLQCEIQSKINTQNTMLDTNESIKLLEATWDTQKQILIDDNYRLNNELQLSNKQRDIYYNQLVQINNGQQQQQQQGTSTTTTTTTGNSLTDTTGISTTTVVQAPGSGIGFTLPFDAHALAAAAVSSPISTGGNTTTNNNSSSMYNTNSAMKHELLLERQAYDAEVTELSEMNRLLRDEIHTKDESIVQIKLHYDTIINTIQDEKITLQNTISTLQQQIVNAPTQTLVDTMKRELRILKRLEYNVHPDGQDDPEMTSIHYNTNTNNNTNTVSTGTGLDGSSSIGVNNTIDDTTGATTTGSTNTIDNDDNDDDLESILVAKLRRLESDLVTERTMKNELRQQIIQLQSQIDTIQQEKYTTDQLVLSLEKDLETAIASQTNNNTNSTTPLGSKKKQVLVSSTSTVSVASSGIDPLQIGNPQTLQNILDPSGTSTSSAPASAVDPEFDTSMLKPSSSSVATDNSRNEQQQQQQQSQHTVASIIIAQRDRLKSRCDILEAERDSFKRELQNQVQTTESLKSDNTKLYEKVRYLQNFSSTTTTTTTSSSNNKNNNSKNRNSGYQQQQRSYNIDNNDLDLEALEQRYEASVDPFKQFNKLERQRKLNEMNSIERTVYIVARTVLSTKEMRSGLFVYVVTLHFLVFITTYHWSHSNDDNNCNFHYMNMEKLAHLPPSLQGPVSTTTTATNKGV